jgi:PAS domain S-box-containing protein
MNCDDSVFKALKESEERFKAFFNGINQPVMVHEFKKQGFGNFIDVNEAACARYGYSRDEFLKLTPADISAREDAEQRGREKARLQLKEKKRNCFKAKHITKNREIFPVEISSNIYTLHGRNIILSVVTDISHRQKVEDELKKAQSYILNIINSMPSVLVGVDSNGNITQWNHEAGRITGIAEDQAVGQPLEKIFPHLSSKLANAKRSIQTKQIFTMHRQPSHKDGQICYEDVTVFPLVTNGVEGAVIRLDDVTERVQLEEMMVQSEKMLSVGGLAAGMAHEINNPLAGMIQTSEGLIRRLTNITLDANTEAATACGITMEGLKKYAEERKIIQMAKTIKETGLRVADIVDNMLSFARKSSASSLSYDMKQLMDKTLDLASADYDLKREYDFKEINIVKHYSDSLPFVQCEGSKIQQVFLNIL